MSAKPPVADLARAVFWGPLRKRVSPERRGELRLLHHTWPIRLAFTSRSDRQMMADEFHRCFGGDVSADPRLVRQAIQSAVRTHVDELMMSKLTTKNIEDHLVFVDPHHLDEAQALGRGVVWCYPHAGPVMLMLAALALRGVDYVQFAARGLAPAHIAAGAPGAMGSTWLRRSIRRAREDHENSLRVTFLDQDTPVRALHRALGRNAVVGIAFDGRMGRGFKPMNYLGREALLSPGPFKLAAQMGAPIVPAFCRTQKNGPSLCHLGTPIMGNNWQVLAQQLIAQQQEWIRQWPEEIGLWLLHCRKRRGADDHPLFTDYAPDDRHLRWVQNTQSNTE